MEDIVLKIARERRLNEEYNPHHHCSLEEGSTNLEKVLSIGFSSETHH